MPNKSEVDRKASKTRAIVRRLAEMGDNAELLIGMLDETKLDLMVLVLGIGETVLTDTTASEA